jgi:hypothetical protein
MNSLTKAPYLPFEMIDLILSYDGRILFRRGRFQNVIISNDPRYVIIEPVICKKMNIISNMEIHDSRYYFEISFDSLPGVGLCYDINWSYHHLFEICYYDFRNPNAHMQQFRTNI